MQQQVDLRPERIRAARQLHQKPSLQQCSSTRNRLKVLSGAIEVEVKGQVWKSVFNPVPFSRQIGALLSLFKPVSLFYTLSLSLCANANLVCISSSHTDRIVCTSPVWRIHSAASRSFCQLSKFVNKLAHGKTCTSWVLWNAFNCAARRLCSTLRFVRLQLVAVNCRELQPNNPPYSSARTRQRSPP